MGCMEIVKLQQILRFVCGFSLPSLLHGHEQGQPGNCLQPCGFGSFPFNCFLRKSFPFEHPGINGCCRSVPNEPFLSPIPFSQPGTGSGMSLMTPWVHVPSPKGTKGKFMLGCSSHTIPGSVLSPLTVTVEFPPSCWDTWH